MKGIFCFLTDKNEKPTCKFLLWITLKSFSYWCEKMVVLKLTYFAKVNCNFYLSDFNLRSQINKPIQLIVSSQKNQVTQVQQMQKCTFAMCWVNYLLEKDICSCTQWGQKNVWNCLLICFYTLTIVREGIFCLHGFLSVTV